MKTNNKLIDYKRIPYTEILILIAIILTPYAFLGQFPISTMFYIAAFVLVAINKSGKIYIRMNSLSYLWIFHLLLSVFAALSYRFTISLVFSIVMISINLFLVMILIPNISSSKLEETAIYFGFIVSVFLIIQSVMLSIGLEPLSGKITFLRLLDNATFVSSTWGFRLNSIFQEPSYLAIFLLPVFYITLKKNNLILSFLFFITLVLSSSSLAIVGSILILAIYLVRFKKVKFIVLYLSLVLATHFLLYQFSDFYFSSINRSINKFEDIFTESSIRIVGQIYLFEYLPIFNKLVGVGVNQMQNYFSYMPNIYNYSNSYVITLINSGIIGLLFYFGFLISLFNYSIKNNKIPIFAIFFIVTAVDYFIYNNFFFYLIFLIYAKENKLNNER